MSVNIVHYGNTVIYEFLNYGLFPKLKLPPIVKELKYFRVTTLHYDGVLFVLSVNLTTVSLYEQHVIRAAAATLLLCVCLHWKYSDPVQSAVVL